MASGQFWASAQSKRDSIPKNVLDAEMPVLVDIFEATRAGLLGFFDDSGLNRKDLMAIVDIFKENPDAVPTTKTGICSFLIYRKVFLAMEQMLESLDEKVDPAKYAFFFDLASGFQYAYGALLLAEQVNTEGHDPTLFKSIEFLKGERLLSNPLVEASTFMGLDRILPKLGDRFKEDPSGFLLFDYMVQAAEAESPDPSRRFFVESTRLAGDLYKKIYPDSAFLNK